LPILEQLFLSSKRKTSEAEKFARLVFFGLLQRYPETTTLNALTANIVSGMKYPDVLESIMRSTEFQQRLSFENRDDYISLLPPEETINKTDIFKFVNSGKNQKFKNIVYLLPAIAWPIGGIKVLVRQSEVINSGIVEGIRSEIFFPESSKFDISWFNHKAKRKSDPIINIDEDVIVIPEIFALKYGKIFNEKKVKYAIFVQNGYFIFEEIFTGNEKDLLILKQIYKNSACILSVSQDTSKCVQKAFDIAEKDISLVKPAIDLNLFNLKNENKKNIITYMPRKLPNHANYIINQLTIRGLGDWKIIPIQGANERETAQLLTQSKIFLSFSDREGLSLPPLEAVLSGNSVIGYDGQGGKDYWSNTLFKKIENGNLLGFIEAVEAEMVRLNSTSFLKINQDKNFKQLNEIIKLYSPTSEIQDLKGFIAKL
jgi:hypothetical protein